MPRLPEEQFRAMESAAPLRRAHWRNPMPRLLPLCVMLLAAATSICAQTYTVLHHFGSLAGDPSGPVFRGTIAQSRGGAMLTTATDQLTDGGGKAFRISTTGSIQVLHQFSGPSGGQPYTGVTL